VTSVLWVVGRKKALARCLAVDRAQQEGLDWSSLPTEERRRRERDALESVSSWVSGKTLAEFVHDYRA
jgi:hypothetical protein